MEQVMILSGWAAALGVSLGLALGLEWLCLRGVFLFLRRAPHRHAGAPRRWFVLLAGRSQR